jgi:hypothetical protein
MKKFITTIMITMLLLGPGLLGADEAIEKVLVYEKIIDAKLDKTKVKSIAKKLMESANNDFVKLIKIKISDKVELTSVVKTQLKLISVIEVLFKKDIYNRFLFKEIININIKNISQIKDLTNNIGIIIQIEELQKYVFEKNIYVVLNKNKKLSQFAKDLYKGLETIDIRKASLKELKKYLKILQKLNM